MSAEELYVRREQTLIKHLILRDYLKRFAYIVGQTWPSITYIDCFAGPWNARSDQLVDSSFAIALDELRKAKATLLQRQKDLVLRGLFLEKDREAFTLLREFADCAGCLRSSPESGVRGVTPGHLALRPGGPGYIPLQFH